MHRVLYICPSSGIGGAETFLKQTFVKANKELFDNHYLLFRTGPLYDYLEQNGAKVHLLKSVPRLSSMSDRKMVATEIKKIINTNNIELVHSTMAYAALFSARVCKQMGTPHVWFQHGPASGWMDRLASLLPHDGLIVNSHYTGKKQRQLENPLRFFLSRKLPIEKILLGSDIIQPSEEQTIDFRNKLINDHNLPENTVILTMLCRIQEWKGVHLLAEALEQLAKESLPESHFAFIWGDAFKDQSYYNSLREKVENEKLPIHLMGSTDNVALALSASDILVNASIQPEPFGYSIIEGMTLGVVPVVPDEGGPLEIISQGKDGLIFEARKAHSLSKKLKMLITDKELREKLSLATRETAHNKYTAARAIAQLEKFHLKVLK